MANRLQSPVPAGVKRYLRSIERQEAKERTKRGERICKLLAAGNTDAAIELMTGARAPAPYRVQQMVDAMPPPVGEVDRSPAAVAARQQKIVDILTSGARCSLNRAWKLAGYGNHRQSLDQLLSSPTVLDLLRRAVDEGRPLPIRIEQALEERDLGIV